MRSRSDRMIAGVLGGLGEYLGVDATLLRLGYALLTLITGVWLGIVVYIVAVVIVPEEPVDVGAANRPPAAPPPPGSSSGPTPSA
ncbi:MAG: PspC domain-containing protein [Coriobacteriales bacterium]|nr:PspC domain-containing protein [Coriobacteriales bacterium]